VSNDGHGELPRRQIEEGLAGGALVHCGFDNDAGGTKLWAQVKEAYPRAEAIERERPPAGAKDWNDARCATPERAEEQRAGGRPGAGAWPRLQRARRTRPRLDVRRYEAVGEAWRDLGKGRGVKLFPDSTPLYVRVVALSTHG